MDEKILSELSEEALEELSNGLEPGEDAEALRQELQSTTSSSSSSSSSTASRSGLVNYTRLSPNCSRRTAKIDRITIHHMAGNLSIEDCGAGFSYPSRRASSNYGIGTDGRVGLYVEETNRAWTSSSSANDNRAVTIEVANSKAADPWPVSDAAYAKLIELCVDICQRNGIARLNYTGNTSGNLTMHKWFAATACPGPYLEARFPAIAAEVNVRLAKEPLTTEMVDELLEAAINSGTLPYTVRVTASVLNIRSGPGTSYSIAGTIRGKGIYTIVQESVGTGSTRGWGKLKSGAGWIALDHVKKI